MNKRGWIVFGLGFVLVLFLASFALALENETTDKVAKAYECLENKSAEKDLSLQEATFSLLALKDKVFFDKVESFKDSNSCWPKGSCKIKETSQVLLAYKEAGKSTTEITKWLLSKNSSANDLIWLLQIDITDKTESACSIKYGQTTSTIKVLEDSKIEGTNLGTCFSIDSGGYMLNVKSNCLKNDFEIICDKNFITSVLYKKSGGSTLFILPETHGASPGGSTNEKIKSDCFKTGGACDYEGTLWATIALHKAEIDVSNFVPYLLALSEDNPGSFPSAFLYILVGGDDQYGSIMDQRKDGKFWEMLGTKGGKFYDTSLAMLGLFGKSEIDSTKDYLLEIQANNGCWNGNNIRDTAFVLYSGWPEGGGAVDGGTTIPATCGPSPLSCQNIGACTSGGGIQQTSFTCPNIGQICCSVTPQELTCAQKGGISCLSNQECDGKSEPASDGECCMSGLCKNIEQQIQEEETCSLAGGECKVSCFDDEEKEPSETCSLEDSVCCVAKPVRNSGLIWIILLISFIALATLGIIYREKVKIWWHTMMEKFKKKPIATGQPSPFGVRPIMQQRPFSQQPMRQGIRPVAKDREMEEALRKLREMSKK